MFSPYKEPKRSEPTMKPAGPTYGIYRDSDSGLPVNPFNTSIYGLADIMSQVTEEIITSYTKGKDQTQDLGLQVFVDLSSYADPEAVSNGIKRPPKMVREDDGKLQEPQAQETAYRQYCATRTTMQRNGMRSLYMPKGEYITSTGVPFDPSDEYVIGVFRTVLLLDSCKIRRAQTQMMTIIRGYFQPGLFQNLDRTLFATDLLQKLWVYLYNRVHQERSSLVQHKEKWTVRPLTNINEFEETIRQAAALNTCTNLLEHVLPLDVNTELVGQLIQALRRNTRTVPASLQAEFNSIAEDLKGLHESGVRLTPTSLLLSLGSLFPAMSQTVPSIDTSGSSTQPILPPVTNSDTNSGRLSSEATTSQAAFAAFAERPAQETVDHTAFAAYPDRSGPKHKSNGTRPTNASKETSDQGSDELTLHQLQKLSELIQSQLSRQARKANIKMRTSDTEKHKAYLTDTREYALGAYPLRPASKRLSSGSEGESEFAQ